MVLFSDCINSMNCLFFGSIDTRRRASFRASSSLLSAKFACDLLNKAFESSETASNTYKKVETKDHADKIASTYHIEIKRKKILFEASSAASL